MSDKQIAETKKSLRQRYLATRQSLARQRLQAASATAKQSVLSYLKANPVASVGGYLAMSGELNIDDLLQAIIQQFPQTAVALPITKQHIKFHPITEFNPQSFQQHTQYLIREPQPSTPINPELLLVPAVAYTEAGNRLGFGGGFYDRYLQANPSKTIGLTFIECIAPELPTESHDQPVDLVISA